MAKPYKFTAARKMALRRAALESARKRRKHHPTPVKKGLSNKQKTAIVVGGAVAVGAGLAAVKYSNGNSSSNFGGAGKRASKEDREYYKSTEYQDEQRKIAQEWEDKNSAALKAAGNTAKAANSQEEWEARLKYYGSGSENVIGEFSPLHDGRPEIFPTIPMVEVQTIMSMETAFPSRTLHDDVDEDGFVTLYHRTGGGKDLDGAEAKAKLLKDQSFQILNRDEKRVAAINVLATPLTKNQLSWFSNKLNDSNTRAAFGEHVVKIKIPKSMIQNSGKFEMQSFGELSPGEVWAAINPSLLKGIKVEDVDPSEIKPAPERKFRAPR